MFLKTKGQKMKKFLLMLALIPACAFCGNPITKLIKGKKVNLKGYRIVTIDNDIFAISDFGVYKIRVLRSGKKSVFAFERDVKKETRIDMLVPCSHPPVGYKQKKQK